MKPVEIAGSPPVLVRGKDGALRAFHNVCRHRGAKLITASCKKALIIYPYHAWSCGLVGKLRSRPHSGGPDETDSFDGGGGPLLDLVEVRCANWNGCVFVNLCG